jgi:ParB family chromosome partitioning protein
VPAFNLNKGNQTAQNRLKLQKERTETEELAMPDARRVPLGRLRPNPFQVRQDFDSPEAQQSLQELAEDIRQRDILEPLVVSLVEEGDQEYYQIIAGERRFRAAQLAGKTHVPVIVKEKWTQQEARLASLSENLQRRNLSLVEEVQFFQALETEYNYSARQISRLISKSESYVSKRLRLAQNPQKLQQLNEKNLTFTEALLGKDEQPANTNPAPVVNNQITATPSQSATAQPPLAKTVRLVPFVRFRDVLERTSEQLTKKALADEERSQLLEEVNQIEQQLAALKKSLKQSNK